MFRVPFVSGVVHYLENRRRQFWFAVICCLVMVRRIHIWSVDAGLAGIHYDTNMDRLTITRQHMTAKPKLSSFILFLMHLI